MEKVLLNLSLVFFVFYFIKKNRHGLHILQLESYYNDRYLGWIKKNLTQVFNLKHIVLLVLPLIVLLINYTEYAVLALSLENVALLILLMVTKKKICYLFNIICFIICSSKYG